MKVTPDSTTSPDPNDLATLWRVYNAAKAAYKSAPDPEEFREGVDEAAAVLAARRAQEQGR